MKNGTDNRKRFFSQTENCRYKKETNTEVCSNKDKENIFETEIDGFEQSNHQPEKRTQYQINLTRVRRNPLPLPLRCP